MNEKAHRKATQTAIWTADAHLEMDWAGKQAQSIIEQCAQTDCFNDLEFVDVAGPRDNPHARQPVKAPDKAHYQTDQKNHTAFNHFIDIKKGPGKFDDYDGYSYFRGSAHTDQYQDACELTGGWGRLAAFLTGFKVDEGIQYWLNDEYVHIPGRPWYCRCSPAVEQYSFPRDLGIYTTSNSEIIARFPLADDHGGNDQGIPYSVFFPVDNLARYWYGRFLKTPGRLDLLGPVLHAVQDAGIPHHAAGYNGNWHVEYENALDVFASKFDAARAGLKDVSAYVKKWNREDPVPPQAIKRRDRLRTPARNWSVAALVTWLAFQAYYEYTHTYRNFKNGFRLNTGSMQRLYTLAVAMSALVLIKARGETSRM